MILINRVVKLRGKNQYLDVQNASDEASKVAYILIGHMLNDFSQIEGC